MSAAVVSEVEERTWPPGTEVCALTVIDLLALSSTVGYLEPFVKSENEAANTLVHAVAERLDRRDLKTTTLVVEGYPGTSIVDEAEKWGADFVLVGSHGHSGFVRFLLGSIAKAVVQNAPCSVEIVRHPSHDRERLERPEHDHAADSRPGMRILLAIDGSDYSTAAVRSVAGRPWPGDCEVRIISVVEQVVPAADLQYAAGAVAERVREDSAKKCEYAVRAAEAVINSAGLRTSAALLDGSPKRRILDEAKEWGAHLIVVGSHGRRGLTRYLLGSVSEAVAMHANCSVEVIREPSLLRA